jgi:hypothetical protein
MFLKTVRFRFAHKTVFYYGAVYALGPSTLRILPQVPARWSLQGAGAIKAGASASARWYVQSAEVVKADASPSAPGTFQGAEVVDGPVRRLPPRRPDAGRGQRTSRSA